jgi:hypothetical protein
VLRAWGFIEAPQVVDYPFRLIGESSGDFSTVENRPTGADIVMESITLKTPFQESIMSITSPGAQTAHRMRDTPWPLQLRW